MKRKDFLKTLSFGTAVLYAPSGLVAQTEKVPPLDKLLVQEFVGAGHNNLDKVKNSMKSSLRWCMQHTIWEVVILKQP